MAAMVTARENFSRINPPALMGISTYYWWFGTFRLCCHALGTIIPINWLIFFRGVGVPPTNQNMFQLQPWRFPWFPVALYGWLGWPYHVTHLKVTSPWESLAFRTLCWRRPSSERGRVPSSSGAARWTDVIGKPGAWNCAWARREGVSSEGKLETMDLHHIQLILSFISYFNYHIF